eukprot:TRINITY_DN1891_c0_g1_i1.p1 TRINITY_DN1891_c0_g1~~TRINITY_DN1891_c0_g1_i1.p1  ORF type:complete len:235 (+),score=34.29 TRINITY_DN1891_c0_g1_i1:65-706(+)
MINDRHLLLFASLISVVLSCDPNLGNSFDYTCDAKTPFCVNTNSATAPQYNCVACREDCDCGQDEFCSTDRWAASVGKCQKITMLGKACYPMSLSQLVNSTIALEGKCAVLASDEQNNLQRIWTGLCVQGKCRACDYSDKTTGTTCGNGYMGPPRVCVFPGEFNTPHSRYWSGGAYYEDPVRVWLAIFFIFIFIITLVNVLSAFFAFRGFMKK